MKPKSLRTLHKEAWNSFSKWVRISEGGICFTCGIKKDWREQDAGHFIHKDCLDFNKIGVHCQCVRCNRWLHGNLGEYAIRLIKKYGLKKVEALKLEGYKVRKFRPQELIKIKKHYEKLVKSLQNTTTQSYSQVNKKRY